jgi:hypothetical protein
MKTCIGLVLAALLAGCSQAPEKSKTNEVFTEWLKEHGQTNIVVDAGGVGIAGNKTRFHASLYGTEQGKTGYSAEVEFKITLPEGGPIIEYVAGLGETKEKAMDQAMANFILTTAHVVYKAFMNPDDSHQRVKSVVINNKPRDLFAGNMIQFGGSKAGSIDLESMSTQTQDLVAAAPMGPGTHWVKFVYCQDHGKLVTVAATLDNKDAPEMTDALNKLKWPERDDFYMVKQFILVK